MLDSYLLPVSLQTPALLCAVAHGRMRSLFGVKEQRWAVQVASFALRTALKGVVSSFVPDIVVPVIELPVTTCLYSPISRAVGVARDHRMTIQCLAMAEAMGERTAAEDLKEVEKALATAATEFESRDIELGLAHKHAFAARWHEAESEARLRRDAKTSDREFIGLSLEESLPDPDEQIGMLQQREFNAHYLAHEKLYTMVQASRRDSRLRGGYEATQRSATALASPTGAKLKGQANVRR